MYLQSSLTVWRETQTVHANTARGLAARAKEKELQAYCDFKSDLAVAIIVFGVILVINTFVFGIYSLFVLVGVVTLGEVLTPRLLKARGSFTSLWYEWQWHHKWNIEYERLRALDSQDFI